MTHKPKSKRRKHFLDTDYAIPKFNFKQAILLMVTLAILLIAGSIIVETVPTQYVLFVIFSVSIFVGFSISFIQFYKKKGAKKKRITIGVLFSILVFLMMFTLYYADILI